MTRFRSLVLLLALSLLVPVAGFAAGSADEESDGTLPTPPPIDPASPQAEVRDRLLIVGDAGELMRLPGSGQRLTEDDLEAQKHSDVHRILWQVPGIYVQEEEGWGLRPNIGIRGTGVERSQKVTLMEDGVLIAPAPYSAPSAYYTPTAARMEGFEILKGPAAIRQGPFTTGGALNYLSTSIPGELGGAAQVAAGEDGFLRAHASVGDSGQRFGWLFEGFRMESDGFKRLDTGGDTGFELDDYVGKLRFTSGPQASRYQALEIKLGKTEQFGEETYVGLTADDFERTPYRRYAGSEEDFFTSDHEQVQASYFAQLAPRLDLTATAYNNDFFRNWHKLQSVAGVGIASVLDRPETYQREVSVLRGELDSAPGEMAVRNNRRDYYSRGVQTMLGWRPGERHDLEIGLRYHEDAEDRFQEEDLFQMVDGRMVLTSLGAPGSNANRVSSADALALFVVDRIDLGRWTLTPGARFESIDLERRDFGKSDPQRTGTALRVSRNRVEEIVPGMGVSYRLSPETAVFAGLHKGFAPPAPGSAEEVEAEESLNYELGWRRAAGRMRADLVGFFNDYDNLLGTDTLSGGGGGTGEQFNGGAARIWGLEASLATRFDVGEGLDVPLRVAYTWTDSEFRTSFETSFADWEPEVAIGDELPYLPAHQLSVGSGLDAERWAVNIDASYVGEMRTRSGSGPIPADQGIESRLVFDLGGEWVMAERYRLFVQVRNLTDEVYVVARRPAGLRPGLPRTVLVGIGFDF